MDASGIRDADSLRAWLEALPQGTEAERDEARRWAVAIAHRASFRASTTYIDSHLHFEDLLDPSELIELFRSLLLPMVFIRSSKEMKKLLSSAAKDVPHPGVPVASRFAGREAARTTCLMLSSDRFASLTLDALDYVADTVNERALWLTVLKDCWEIPGPTKLHNFPIWPADDELSDIWPEENPILVVWYRSREIVQGFNEGWRFWIDWYDNALHGRPQDYDLLTKIALIDPEDWNKGADHVNALIQKIVEQHTLAQDARALKEEIAQIKRRLQSVEHRSHNNPPELVDETIAQRKEVTIIWAVLDEAERELEKPDPDPSALARIGAFLKAASMALAQYCSSLVDLAAKTSVRTAAATGTAMAFASQSEQLKAYGEALLQFAKSLGAP